MTLARPPRARDLSKLNGFEINEEGHHEGENSIQQIHDNAVSKVQEHGRDDSGNGNVARRYMNSLELEHHMDDITLNPDGQMLNEDWNDREREYFTKGSGSKIINKNENSRESMGNDEERSSNVTDTRNRKDIDEDMSSNIEVSANEKVDNGNNLKERSNGTLTKNNYSSEKLEVITEDGGAHPNRMKIMPDIPVVVITANDSYEGRLRELDTQGTSLDFGCYELSNERVVNDSSEDRLESVPSGTDMPLKRVDFKVGGEEDTESESSRTSSPDDKSTNFMNAKLVKGGRQIMECKVKDNTNDDNSHADDRLQHSRSDRKLYDAEKGFVRVSGPADMQRSYSVEEGNNFGSISSPRVLQDICRPVSYSDDSVDVVRSVAGSRKNSVTSNGSGKVGILKKPSSQTRLEICGSDRSIERDSLSPTVNMSEGLRRYRRRSQLSITSEISADGALKRHVENDSRNKDNLEFIKRRVSLQNEPSLIKGGDDNAQEAARRNWTSPGHVDDQKHDYNSYPEQSWRYSRSPSPVSNNFSPLNDTSRGDRNDGPGPAAGHTGRMSRNSSRESLGERIVVSRTFSDEEINEYLGNILPNERHYGLLPSHAQLEPVGSDLQQRNRSSGYDDDLDEPYVPIRKQRTMSDCQTRGANQNIVKRMPVTEPLTVPTRPSSGPSTSRVLMDSAFLSSLSLAGQQFAASLRKDSIALFNTKLNGTGPSRLRRFSQASIAEFEELKRKHASLAFQTDLSATSEDY